MNTESVKRVLALLRQINAVAAMVRRGLLTKEEGDVLMVGYQKELAELRAQSALPLKSDAPSKK